MSGIKHPSPPEQLIDHPGQRVHDRLTGVRKKGGGLREPLNGFQATRREVKPIANCASGVIAAGNCNGDPYWQMPNGDWWNFPGVGGGASNRNRGTILRNNPQNVHRYDFMGGQRTLGAPPLPHVNKPIYTGGFQVVRQTPLIQTQQRTWHNCNCGINGGAAYNCYTACNCACACACNCACDCACFLRGTPVLMADGSQKPIETLVRGERVIGAFGLVNEIRQICVGRVGGGGVFLINDKFLVLGGHRLWVRTKGWACADPDDFERELEADRRGFGERRGQNWMSGDHVPANAAHRLEVGDPLAFGVDGTVPVETLVRIQFPEDTLVYEPIIHNGSGSYTVYGGFWATGAPDYGFDFDARVEFQAQPAGRVGLEGRSS